MQEQVNEAAPRSGAQAVTGAVIAVLGALAAVRPDNPLLKALSEAVPQLATALPAAITACGAGAARWVPTPRYAGAKRQLPGLGRPAPITSWALP